MDVGSIVCEKEPQAVESSKATQHHASELTNLNTTLDEIHANKVDVPFTS